MKLNFKISEFNISGNAIPERIADAILIFHIAPMQVVRDILGFAIWPSLKSGYRPVSWERSHKRSGSSQHCFLDIHGGKGAVDWTCSEFSKNKQLLLSEIIKNTDYTRIAVYNTFIHCDYKKTNSGKRETYTSDSKSNWKLDKIIN